MKFSCLKALFFIVSIAGTVSSGTAAARSLCAKILSAVGRPELVVMTPYVEKSLQELIGRKVSVFRLFQEPKIEITPVSIHHEVSRRFSFIDVTSGEPAMGHLYWESDRVSAGKLLSVEVKKVPG